MVNVHALLAQDPHLLPAGACGDADGRVRRLHDLRDRNLDRDRVGVVASDGVLPRLRGERYLVERVKGTQPRKVEYGPEVDEERIVALASEHFDAPGQRMDRRRS